MLTAQIAATLAAFLLMITATVTERAFAAGVELRGAGSTFVAPLMNGWIKYFENSQPDVGIYYDAVGSGEGVSRFLSGSVDFAASDNVLPPVETQKIDGGVVQVPSAAGMIVFAYNLPGVKGRLKLPQEVYVDIFLGKIQSWNDPRIRAANKDLNLPAINIAVVGRQDSSGTTYAFTDHLAAVSKSWSDGPGVGKLIQWPHVAMLARGNEGVASKIKISQGAIGYLEYGFALRLGLQMAVLENKAGQFVAPTPVSGAAALTPTMDVSLDALDASTANPPGLKAYPIVAYTWLLLYPGYPAEKARALVSFLNFAYEEGQSYAPYFGYLALPEPVIEQARVALARFGSSSAAAPETDKMTASPNAQTK
jgi:phosphate transport system substrate-binding protein